jgi:hypothetical protein
MPKLNSGQIDQLSALVADYIALQRTRYLPRARPLSAAQKTAMADFFSPQLLDNARSLVLESERVANPDFYSTLRNLGFNDLPDQSTMRAITFVDTVVSHGPFNDSLLFHELVHVEQYRQLGISSFSTLYVRGFLERGGYEEIPLERNAYMLGARFEKDRSARFPVAAEVAKWIEAGLF